MFDLKPGICKNNLDRTINPILGFCTHRQGDPKRLQATDGVAFDDLVGARSVADATS